jgi:hypothetical protein
MRMMPLAMATRGAVEDEMETINAVCNDELVEYEKVQRIVLEVFDEEFSLEPHQEQETQRKGT